MTGHPVSAENQTAQPPCLFAGRSTVTAHCGQCVQEQMLPPRQTLDFNLSDGKYLLGTCFARHPV